LKSCVLIGVTVKPGNGSFFFYKLFANCNNNEYNYYFQSIGIRGSVYIE